MARWLIEQQSTFGMFFNEQKASFALDDCSHGNVRFPDHIDQSSFGNNSVIPR
jgi:hypothetical protein